MAGLGLMAWLGIGDGLLSFIVALVAAAAVALLFIVLRVPKYLVLIATSYGGAFAAVTGVALILGRVPVSALNAGTAGAYVADSLSWVWISAALVLGTLAFLYQWRQIERLEFITYDELPQPGDARNGRLTLRRSYSG